MAAHTKVWDVDNTAYVEIVVDTPCDHVTVYENARAATTDLLVKGRISGSAAIIKVAGEKIEFRSRGYVAHDIVGYIKCVSAVTATMAQEEDYDG